MKGIIKYILALAIVIVPAINVPLASSGFSGIISVSTEKQLVLNNASDYDLPIIVDFFNANNKPVNIPKDFSIKAKAYSGNVLIKEMTIDKIMENGTGAIAMLKIKKDEFDLNKDIKIIIEAKAGISTNNTVSVQLKMYDHKEVSKIVLSPVASTLNLATDTSVSVSVNSTTYTSGGKKTSTPLGLKLKYTINSEEKAYYQNKDRFITNISKTAFRSQVGDFEVYNFIANTNIPVEPIMSPIKVIKELLIKNIILSDKTVRLEPTETYMLYYDIEPKNATNRDSIIITSEDEEIVKVDQSGVLTAVGNGSTFVRIQAGEVSVRVPVVVKAKIKRVQFGASQLYINVEEQRQLDYEFAPSFAQPDSMIWLSDDHFTVDVDDNGVITANKSGTTKIRLIVDDIEAVITVNVMDDIKEIILSDVSAFMNVGSSKQFDFTTYPKELKNYLDVKWESSNENVVKVNDKGLVVGVGSGTATIKVYYNDVSAEAEIYVDLQEEDSLVKTTVVNIELYDKIMMSDIIKDNLNIGSLEISVSHPDILEIVGDEIHAIDSGTASIEVKQDNNTSRIQVFVQNSTGSTDSSLTSHTIESKYIHHKIAEGYNDLLFDGNDASWIIKLVNKLDIDKVADLQENSKTKLAISNIEEYIDLENFNITANVNAFGFYFNQDDVSNINEIALLETPHLSLTQKLHEQELIVKNGLNLKPISIIYTINTTGLSEEQKLIYALTEEDIDLSISGNYTIALFENDKISNLIHPEKIGNKLYFTVSNGQTFAIMNFQEATKEQITQVKKENDVKPLFMIVTGLSFLGCLTGIAIYQYKRKNRRINENIDEIRKNN